MKSEIPLRKIFQLIAEYETREPGNPNVIFHPAAAIEFAREIEHLAKQQEEEAPPSSVR